MLFGVNNNYRMKFNWKRASSELSCAGPAELDLVDNFDVDIHATHVGNYFMHGVSVVLGLDDCGSFSRRKVAYRPLQSECYIACMIVICIYMTGIFLQHHRCVFQDDPNVRRAQCWSVIVQTY